MTSLWRASLSRHLQEIRLVMCQTSTTSAGTREFVKQHYLDLKHLNPGLPILVREAENVNPKLTVRYDFGKEEQWDLAGQDARMVQAKLKEAVELGQTLPKSSESAKPADDII